MGRLWFRVKSDDKELSSKRGFTTRQAEAEEAILAERRTFDERYRPVDMISLKAAYAAASQFKEMFFKFN